MKSLELIREFLQDRLAVAPERAVAEARLADLGVDSMMMLELMFEFEDRFGVELPKDMKPPQTVGDMVAQMDHLIGLQQA